VLINPDRAVFRCRKESVGELRGKGHLDIINEFVKCIICIHSRCVRAYLPKQRNTALTLAHAHTILCKQLDHPMGKPARQSACEARPSARHAALAAYIHLIRRGVPNKDRAVFRRTRLPRGSPEGSIRVWDASSSG